METVDTVEAVETVETVEPGFECQMPSTLFYMVLPLPQVLIKPNKISAECTGCKGRLVNIKSAHPSTLTI